MIHYITTQGLGQPWVGNELYVLRRQNVPFVLHAMRRPEQKLFDSEWAAELNRDTRTIYPIPPLAMVVSMLLAPLLFRRRFVSALFNALIGKRESARARVGTLAHFLVACHWALQVHRETVSHIHSQWAHSSASIGMYGAWLLGVSFSFTGHGVDLFRDRVALSDKIRRADFIICISTFHRDFYLSQGASEDQLHIAYCGIDPDVFSPRERHREPDAAYRVLGAGRLVEKKGFRHLIEACKLLAERGEVFECVIAGSGELEQELRDTVRQHALVDRIRITGKPLTQEQIPLFMHGGDVFCLPCVWARDNDVDGLPQLLMEAMACGVPVISTRLVGIPDLIIDGRSGILVDPNDVEALADAIQSLMKNPERANRLARAGRQRVSENFDLDRSLHSLIAQFKRKLGLSNGRVARFGSTAIETRPPSSAVDAQAKP